MVQVIIILVSSLVDVLPDMKAKSLDCQKNSIVIVAVCNLNGKLALAKFINVLMLLLKFPNKLVHHHVQVCVRIVVCAHKAFALALKDILVNTVNTKCLNLMTLWCGI